MTDVTCVSDAKHCSFVLLGDRSHFNFEFIYEITIKHLWQWQNVPYFVLSLFAWHHYL